VAPPTIFVQANSLTPPITYTITITGLLDLTLAPFPVNNINLYASYDFVINKDIVTDDGQNITTDTGTNITTD
jgi:predicted benzoate:H+ symporter BenE